MCPGTEAVYIRDIEHFGSVGCRGLIEEITFWVTFSVWNFCYLCYQSKLKYIFFCSIFINFIAIINLMLPTPVTSDHFFVSPCIINTTFLISSIYFYLSGDYELNNGSM